MNVEQIQELLPHRPPMLLVDRVESIEPGKHAVAFKDVGPDEFWCAGHFPGQPILPGVLISEALAQTAALVYMTLPEATAGQPVYLVGMDKMRFRRPVRPGDSLRLEATVTANRRRMWTFDVNATVGGQRVANGSLLATLPDPGAGE